jgi:transmembrane protein DUF3566
MSNSGDNQPLAPRRPLQRPQTSGEGSTPPMQTSQTSVDGPPTPSMGTAPYARGSRSRRAATPVPPAPAAAAGATTYPLAGSPAKPQSSTGRPGTSPGLAASSAKAVRRARLRLIRIDPWSVTKAAFLLSIALGIMWVVAVFLVMSVMSAAGLWDHVNQSIQGVLNQNPGDRFDIKDYINTRRVLGLTMLIGALDVILITALATLGAFLYNMAASLLGGIEVTLAEDARR